MSVKRKLLNLKCLNAFKNLDSRSKDCIKDYFIIPVTAIIIAVLIRTFFFDNFHIPTGSMENTLLVGDKITVSKMSYGYGRYSFPFGVFPFKGRIFFTEPERGDIIVFKLPSNKRINYVKRLIGLPGDTVQIKNSILYINGQEIKRRQVNFAQVENADIKASRVKEFVETLPNGRSYITLDSFYDRVADDTREFRVPAKHYFFLGDNRDNSRDSRFEGVGFINEELLLGKVKFIMISSPYRIINPLRWSKIRFSRIGHSPYIDTKELTEAISPSQNPTPKEGDGSDIKTS